jgi:hypothetical protein
MWWLAIGALIVGYTIGWFVAQTRNRTSMYIPLKKVWHSRPYLQLDPESGAELQGIVLGGGVGGVGWMMTDADGYRMLDIDPFASGLITAKGDSEIFDGPGYSDGSDGGRIGQGKPLDTAHLEWVRNLYETCAEILDAKTGAAIQGL